MGRKDIRTKVAARAAEHRRLMDELEEVLKNPLIPESEKTEARMALAKARNTRLRLSKTNKLWST